MDKLISFLALGIMLYSVINLIGYHGRRSDSKWAIKNLLSEAPHRVLSPDELAIVRRLKPKGDINPDVFILEGEYKRHGLSSNSGTIWHDLIGDIEVNLPFSAHDFLSENNVAEVIQFDKKQMLVISLNDRFTLTEAEKIEQAKVQNQEQWQSGSVGEFSDIPIAVQSASTTGNNEQANEEQSELIDHYFKYKILSSRDENSAEVHYRYHPGYKILASILFAGGFGSLLFSTQLNSLSTYLSAILFIIALFTLFKSRALPAPQAVNRVQGTLLDTDEGILLGKHYLDIPLEWRSKLSLRGRERIYDISADYRLLSADGMTVEHDTYPKIHWGKYVLPTIVAIAALIFGLGTFNQPVADAYYTWNMISGAKPTSYTRVSDFKSNPPEAGDYIHLSGEIRCWFSEEKQPRNTCNRQLFGAPDKLVELPKLDPTLKKISDGDWVSKAHISRFAQLILKSKLLSYNRSHINKKSIDFDHIYRLQNIDALVDLVNQYCSQRSTKDKNCLQLKQEIQRNLPVSSWDKAEGFAEKHKHSQVFKLSRRNSFQQALHRISRDYSNDMLKTVRQTIEAEHHQGVLIDIIPRPKGLSHNYWRLNAWQRLMYNYQLANGELNAKIDRFGVVTSVNQQGIAINTQRQLNHPWSFIQSTLFFTLAFLLLIWQGVLLLITYARNVRLQKEKLA